MKTPRLRSKTVAAACAGALAVAALIPSAASADTQPVTATAASTIGIVVLGPVTLTSLAPGVTSTGSGTVAILATGPWVLRISDGDATHPGHLLRQTGTTGTTFLANALAWSTSTLLGGTGASGTLSATPTVAASGTLVNTVTASYSQPVDSTESIQNGNQYGLTVTWTVSAT
jgi:hypothetical protein